MTMRMPTLRPIGKVAIDMRDCLIRRGSGHGTSTQVDTSPKVNLTRKYIPRLIDPIFSKLGRPFGQFVLALSAVL